MFTNEGLKLAGFSPITADTPISATFSRVEAFRAQGFTVDDEVLIVRRSGRLRGVRFNIALSNSLNRICRELVDDDFSPDEPKWLKENQASPPFVVVHQGPTDVGAALAGHWGRFDGHLVTYGAFSDIRARLREEAMRLIPQLLTSLSSHFSQLPEQIRFDSIYADIIGRTTSGEQLTDITMEANATISVSSHRQGSEIAHLVSNALEGAGSIAHSAADYFYLASKEKDALKAFLFFFLSIEVQVHKTFLQVDREKGLEMQLAPLSALPSAGRQLFASVTNTKELKERFIWCAVCAWRSLTDSDVIAFSDLKELRNAIAHGRRATVTSQHVRLAHGLAAKVLAQTRASSLMAGQLKQHN
jgi:hypothetical protein